MKISFGMIVLNGEPFIKYNLENLYPHAHQILIVEGAVEKFKHAATPDGHSIDNTVEMISSFPDPGKKIRLIQRDGFWPEKDEMCNAYLEYSTGDYIWQVDVDEFYKSTDIIKVRDFLSNTPDIMRVDIKTVNFWHSFSAVMQGATYIYGADEFRRIFRFKPGYRYLTHRPPTVVNQKGEIVSDRNIISAKDLSEKLGVYIYHYSYVFPMSVKEKSEYYSKMNWGQGHEDGVLWFNDEWKRLSNPLRIHIIKYPPSWIVPFREEHPEVIQKMVSELGYKENPALANFLKRAYRQYQNAGENLTRIILKFQNGKLGKLQAIFQTLINLFLPFDARNRRANISILLVGMRIWRSNVVG